MADAIWGNNPGLHWEKDKTHKYKMLNYLLLKRVVHFVTAGLKGVKPRSLNHFQVVTNENIIKYLA